MNPQQPLEDDDLQNVNNPLKVMQPGERVICEIKRHPYGLFGMYATLGLVILIAIAAIVGAPMIVSGITSHTQAIIALGAVILCAMIGLFTYISATVYKGNRWIVTSDSITEITQISLFRKQTSQLSLANLEDVTVEQNGIIQSMFGFGTLHVETAGEKSKFIFPYCPDPSKHAKLIIGAHEAYIAEKPSEMHTTNQAVANTSGFNQSYAPPQPQQYTQVPQQPAQMQPEQPMQQSAVEPVAPQPQYEQPTQQPAPQPYEPAQEPSQPTEQQ